MVLSMVSNDNNMLHVSYYESALARQGAVDLTLTNPDDSNKIHDDDTLDIIGLHDSVPGDPVTIVVHHPDHSTDQIQALHA